MEMVMTTIMTIQGDDEESNGMAFLHFCLSFSGSVKSLSRLMGKVFQVTIFKITPEGHLMFWSCSNSQIII